MTTGELLYNLQVVALDDWGAEVIQVKVAGDPKVGQGAMLKLDGLVGVAVVDGRPLRRVVPGEPDRVARRGARRAAGRASRRRRRRDSQASRSAEGRDAASADEGRGARAAPARWRGRWEALRTICAVDAVALARRARRACGAGGRAAGRLPRPGSGDAGARPGRGRAVAGVLASPALAAPAVARRCACARRAAGVGSRRGRRGRGGRVRGGRRACCRSRARRSARCCGCGCSAASRSASWTRAASSWRRACACVRYACGASRGRRRWRSVVLVRRDPFDGRGRAAVADRRDADELSLWEPIPVGVDEQGELRARSGWWSATC